MDYLTAYHTDKGERKPTNQDALCLKVADSIKGRILFAVICDGMGGLDKGELASASVIRAFSAWFDHELNHMANTENYGDLEYQWTRIIQEQNQRIAEYGNKKGIKLGTTLTTLLIVGNTFYSIHVGDTRLYCISDRIQQLTKDQTVVAREIQKGNLTPEQAERDPRRNVLLQCIGASRIVKPDFLSGIVKDGTMWMLCSDGFRHKVSEKEMLDAFSPSVLRSEEAMSNQAVRLVELNKSRKETDNITVLLVKAF